MMSSSYDWKHFEGTADGKKNEVNKILSRMDEIWSIQEYNEGWYSQQFADRNRKGLPVVPYGHLMQYSNYLKGVYFHSTMKYKEALHWYTESLKQGCDKTRITSELNKLVQSHSVNFWRLQALENIEMILTESEAIRANTKLLARRTTKKTKKKTKNKMIYKYLSHHYVLRRSVVFIVDTEFTGVFYHDKANKYVRRVFDKLDPEDYFGYISLGKKRFED